MRVGIIGLLHESNTFVTDRTTLAHFEQDTLLVGEAVRQRFANIPHEIGGFFAGLDEAGIEAVPIFAARAVPSGTIETDSFEQLIRMMRHELASAANIDGLLVAPHGATVCESIPDADGYWLQQVRQDLGDQIPIVGTLDAHANLSQLMVESTNALIAYRTNPHLDQRDRGLEAAGLIASTLRGEVKPVQRAAFPPLAISIERQLTTEPHLEKLYGLANASRKLPGVLSNSILLGFPYADVQEMGSAILVVSDGDQELASNQAGELANYIIEHREDFDGRLTSITDALAESQSMDGPICLLDMGDNVGGGSPGDSTHIVQEIWRQGLKRAVVCICDPQSTKHAEQAGIDSIIELQIGGKTDSLHGSPLVGSFRVLGIYDGKFTEPEVRHGGMANYDQGRSAVVQSTDQCKLTILLNSKRTPPFSLMQLISCDIDPAKYHLVIAKGVNAPVAAYDRVCKHFIRVNSPGCTTADMKTLEYQHRRRPLFPFEEI